MVGTEGDVATARYGRQCPTSCRDGNHTAVHDVCETRHLPWHNGRAPNPHRCHRQNLPRPHPPVGAWRRVVGTVAIRALLNAAIATSRTAPVVPQNHTTSACQWKATSRFLITVLRVSFLVGRGITHEHRRAIVCQHDRRPHHHCSGFTCDVSPAAVRCNKGLSTANGKRLRALL